MNKEIFLALSEHLSEKVPELRQIDWDEGQLNIQERPPISLPSCLIDIQYTNCKDLDEKTQLVTANIILKLSFMPGGEISSNAPKNVRMRALEVFDTVEKVHKCLQGETLDRIVSEISRIRAFKTVRRDKIQVYTITYSLTFQELV